MGVTMATSHSKKPNVIKYLMRPESGARFYCTKKLKFSTANVYVQSNVDETRAANEGAAPSLKA